MISRGARIGRRLALASKSSVWIARLPHSEAATFGSAFSGRGQVHCSAMGVSSRHVQVFAGDVLVAESEHPMVLDETGLPSRWYLQPGDVRVPLEPSDTSFRCPYKGRSSYFSVRLPDGREIADAAWSYPDPLPESARIAKAVCFRHDELTILVDGEPI